MGATNLRSSRQLYIDADLDFKSSKVVNLASGSANTDGVNVGQMNTAISNAVSGLSLSLHVPVADLAGAKAVPAGERADKMQMLIEALGLYRYDAESAVASNDTTVIRPTDIATDATAGRWIKISNSLTDHNLMNSIQGGAAGDYQHLTSAQLTKLNGIEALADVTDAVNVGAAINSVAAKALPVDADVVGFLDSAASWAMKKMTFTNLKDFLKTYFDTLYNKYVHPNHTGEVTSAADGATTIVAGVVTNAKLANMNTATIKGRTSAGAGAPEDLSAAQARAILNVADGANAYVHPNHSGDVTSVGDGALTIAANVVTNAKLADMATQTFKGRNTAATGDPEDLSIATARAMLGLNANNLSSRTYRATPGGTVSGSNTDFPIAALIIPGTEEVFVNGYLMNAGAENDYTIINNTPVGSTTIRFTVAPSNTPFVDVILVNYSV